MCGSARLRLSNAALKEDEDEDEEGPADCEDDGDDDADDDNDGDNDDTWFVTEGVGEGRC